MIWHDHNGAAAIRTIQGTLYRLVESQQTIATLDYVDTLEEQAVLESMLESSKPSWPAHTARYHYLLRTPFRYPPLDWGSRFGSAHEPSLLYAGLSRFTTLAESAYYRFVFMQSMATPGPQVPIHSQHTLFTARYRTPLGVQLQAPPFDRERTRLTDPSHYGITQALGAEMRHAGVQAFEYPSARDPEHGTCVALFSTQALADTRPRTTQRWICETRPAQVSFKPVHEPGILQFPLSLFLQDDQLPTPA